MRDLLEVLRGGDLLRGPVTRLIILSALASCLLGTGLEPRLGLPLPWTDTASFLPVEAECGGWVEPGAVTGFLPDEVEEVGSDVGALAR